jgi:hypothetical protein
MKNSKLAWMYEACPICGLARGIVEFENLHENFTADERGWSRMKIAE